MGHLFSTLPISPQEKIKNAVLVRNRMYSSFFPWLYEACRLIRSITYSEFDSSSSTLLQLNVHDEKHPGVSQAETSQVVNLLLKAVNPNGPPPRAKGSVNFQRGILPFLEIRVDDLASLLPCTQTDVTFQDPGRFVFFFL